MVYKIEGRKGEHLKEKIKFLWPMNIEIEIKLIQRQKPLVVQQLNEGV